MQDVFAVSEARKVYSMVPEKRRAYWVGSSRVTDHYEPPRA